MYDSQKKHSPSQVGKYGMGSRSFFHIGDLIQIVSGTRYAILDPDDRLEGNFGEQTDFVEKAFGQKSLTEVFPDECAKYYRPSDQQSSCPSMGGHEGHGTTQGGSASRGSPSVLF